MNILTGIIVAIVLIAAYLFDRNRRSRANVRPDELQKHNSKSNSEFHAVSLKCEQNACQVAKDMRGRRFLSSAAPRIPLPECDARECSCRFVHYQDRRKRENRRSPFGEGSFLGIGKEKTRREQRENSERRSKNSDIDF